MTTSTLPAVAPEDATQYLRGIALIEWIPDRGKGEPADEAPELIVESPDYLPLNTDQTDFFDVIAPILPEPFVPIGTPVAIYPASLV
jgi:hypothetical protein